jgi:GxxExxY protein
MEALAPRRNLYPELSHAIIGCAMRVHTALGPGMLESVYEQCLGFELHAAGLEHRRQVAVPLRYKAWRLEAAFRIDLLVEAKAIVEVKAVERLLPVHESQLFTYMRMSGTPLGLLINFNVPHLRNGIKRRIYTAASAEFGPSRGTTA